MRQLMALDLGTTRIKGGLFDGSGRLNDLTACDAPPLRGEAGRRESPAAAYLAQATAVRDRLLAGTLGDVSIGVASQRSTFTVWDARTGEAKVPLISWQDRLASAWCSRREADASLVRRTTGLPLSPHYVGPKLARLIEERPDLRDGLASGELRVGTLDSWVLWHWSTDVVHETDLTMAARTLLADPRAGCWVPALLDLFGVPNRCLASIESCCDRSVSLDRNRTVVATVADQAAGALAAVGDRIDAVLINLGTGGFVMRPVGPRMAAVDGYLCGPLLATANRRLFALEGTINGGGEVIDRFAAPPTDLPSADAAPDAFALSDDAGIGAPHWRADQSLTLSRAAERLDPIGQRRTVAEGLVFRVREIVDDLSAHHAPSTIYLSGGLSRDPFFAAALAACLGRTVEVLEDGEQTLRGAAWLAAGRPSGSWPRRSRLVNPASEHRWLRDKYPRWRRWLDGLLAK